MSNQNKHSEITEKDFITSYMTLGECLQKKMPWPSFVDFIQRYSSKDLFFLCTQIASELANHKDPDNIPKVQQEARRITQSWFFHTNLDLHKIGKKSKTSSEFNVYHEQNLLFLQASAIAFGAAKGPIPNKESMIIFALAASDYLPEFSDKSRISIEDWLVATIFIIGRYNLMPDAVAQLLRFYMILRQKPRRDRFSTMPAWNKLQKRAFGIPFDEYFKKYAAPLFMNSYMWNAEGTGRIPKIKLNDFFANTMLDKKYCARFLKELTQTATQARTSIIKGMINGRPHDWTCFLHHPFIRFDDDVLIPVSPWAVRNQLHLGLWHKFLDAAKTTDNKKGADAWFATFGDLFEEWCQYIAQKVENNLPSSLRLITPETTPERLSDPNEIEDVVLVSDDCVVLFSVKSKIIPKELSRTTKSAENILKWLKFYLFGHPARGYRGGAVRLLDKKITELRRGAFVPRVPSNLSVIPVLVTYDRIPEGTIMNQWINNNCSYLNLLKGDNIAPLTLMSPDEYESVWGLASHGINVMELFKLRFQQKYQYVRWSVIVQSQTPGKGMQRPDWLEDEFNHLLEQIKQNLFGIQ